MSHIIRGSLVSVVFSITAFSHSDVENLHSYSGVPCLLDITAGTGMILNALDEAILSMQVGDVRGICIPAADAPESARALGVQLRGWLKYELKVIGVVNTPTSPEEIARFFDKGTVSLRALGETRDVKKGPFNISRTYDMFEAAAISEEYRILELLHKDNVSHTFDTSEESKREKYVSSHSRKRLRHEENVKTLPCYSIPFHSDNIDSRFLIPTWPVEMPKEQFLPHLMSLALESQSKVIVLFDSPNDWQNIETFRSEQSNDTEFRLEQAKEINDLNCTGQVLYRYSIIHAKNSLSLNTTIPVPIPGSDLWNVLRTNNSFTVESEEGDSTGECVLTWLRISEGHSGEYSEEYSSMEDVSYQNTTTTNREGEGDGDKEEHSDGTTGSCNTSKADKKHSNNAPSEQHSPSTSNKNKKMNAQVSGMKIGMDLGSNGFRIALIRFSGWDRGCPPQNRLWQGFIDLYDKVLSELTASTIAASASASKDKPKDKSKNKSLSVLLVDVGSPHGPRNKDSERRFHPQGEHSENASGSQTLDSRTVNACGFQNSHSRPDECIGGAGDVGGGATVENDESIGNFESVRNAGNEEVECVRWGVGDRVGLFLFIQGVKGEVQKTELEPIVESESGGGVIQGGGIGLNNSDHDIDRKGGRVVDCEDKNSDATTHTHPPSPSRSESQLRSSCPAHTDICQVSDTPVHEESRFNLNSNIADRNTSAKLLMHAKQLTEQMDLQTKHDQEKAKTRLNDRLKARTETPRESQTRIRTDGHTTGGMQPVDIINSEEMGETEVCGATVRSNAGNDSELAPMPPNIIAPLPLSLPLTQSCPSVLPPHPPSCPPSSSSSFLPSPPSSSNLISNTLQSITDTNTEKSKISAVHFTSDVDKNEETIPNNNTDPRLCIPEILYNLATNVDNDALRHLFVTHAQYKFAYKIACQMVKK